MLAMFLGASVCLNTLLFQVSLIFLFVCLFAYSFECFQVDDDNKHS